MQRLVSLITGGGFLNGQFDELLAAKLLRQPPCGGLVELHQWRVYAKLLCHPKRQRASHRLDCFGTTVRISGIIRLAHSSHEVVYTSTECESCRRGQEQQIASRHKGVRQAICAHADRHRIRQCRPADL